VACPVCRGNRAGFRVLRYADGFKHGKPLKGNSIGGAVIDLAGTVECVDKINEGASGVYRVNQVGGFIVWVPRVPITAAWQSGVRLPKKGADFFKSHGFILLEGNQGGGNQFFGARLAVICPIGWAVQVCHGSG
jgi:hypothetical protein